MKGRRQEVSEPYAPHDRLSKRKGVRDKTRSEPRKEANVKFRHFVDQKKIAGRDVNGKEGSILNTTE